MDKKERRKKNEQCSRGQKDPYNVKKKNYTDFTRNDMMHEYNGIIHQIVHYMHIFIYIGPSAKMQQFFFQTRIVFIQ